MNHELIRENFNKIREAFQGYKFKTDFDADPVKITTDKPVSAEQSQLLLDTIKSMETWRKGPYQLLDLYLDSEWLGDIKWQRIKNYIPDLTGKVAADIGASNGYYSFKLLTKNPKLVQAFDPFKVCKYQFDLLNFFIKEQRIQFFLKGVEDLVHLPEAYDFMLYMGVLYHRKDPVASFRNIYNSLKPGGEVLTETLVLPAGDLDFVEIPDRYSKMKNVYCLPTIAGLIQWLEESGFQQNKIISVSQTSTSEQRISSFAPFQSLNEFLDPNDPDKTVEGLPAPRRILIISKK